MDAYQLEPEFLPPTPRPIPEQLRCGAYGQQLKYTTLVTGAAGCLCLFAYKLPAVQRLSYNFLPLGYLNWFGLLLLIGSAVALVRWKFNFGAYLYVQNGMPFPVEVLEIQQVPKMEQDGQVVRSAFAVRVVDEQGEEFWLESPDFITGGQDTSLRVGQKVTALAASGKETTLYGFLRLNPDVDFFRKRSDPAATFTGLAVVTVLLSSLVAALHVLNNYPLLGDVGPSMGSVAVFGLLVGAPVLIWLLLDDRRNVRLRDERNRRALEEGGATTHFDSGLFSRDGWKNRLLIVIVVLGCWMLGAALVYTSRVYLNAHWDISKIRHVEVACLNLTQTTHSFIYREYKVEFKNPESGATEDRNIRLEQIPTGEVKTVRLHVRDGYYGWPWVQSVDLLSSEPGR